MVIFRELLGILVAINGVSTGDGLVLEFFRSFVEKILLSHLNIESIFIKMRWITKKRYFYRSIISRKLRIKQIRRANSGKSLLEMGFGVLLSNYKATDEQTHVNHFHIVDVRQRSFFPKYDV